MNPPQRRERDGRRVDVGVQAEIVDRDANRAVGRALGGARCGGAGAGGGGDGGGNGRRRLAWFIVVGSLAAAVHWSVVVGLVRLADWPPLLANVIGWMVAFAVSFSGHHHLSFRAHGVRPGLSALRFFAVSFSGFVVNETAYALLMHWSDLRFDLLLAGVLVAVAGATYWLSRHWVFLRSPGP